MKALLVVDMQYDFLPGGALGVERGDEVIGPINRAMKEYQLVVGTQDWHPPDHLSFAASHEGKKPGDVIELDGAGQIMWPVHCVEESHGAELAMELDARQFAAIFRKGMDRRVDSYSAFYDNRHLRSTGLAGYLKSLEVKDLVIVGLALDYCVKYSALDAVKEGFRVELPLWGSRAVNLEPDDGKKAIEEMREAGVKITVED